MGVNKRDEAAAPRSGERGKRGLLIPSRTGTVCFTAYGSGGNGSGGTRRKAIRPQGMSSAPPGAPFFARKQASGRGGLADSAEAGERRRQYTRNVTGMMRQGRQRLAGKPAADRSTGRDDTD